MSWTRLDDGWTDDPLINEMSFPDRWHYLSMIQFCSRTKKYDGKMRSIDASRCSDHPDAPGALQRMAVLGLVTIEGASVTLNMIDDHIPPPSVRENSERSKIRMRRSRLHKAENHSECLADHCAALQAVTAPVTPRVTRNTRTGQDRTGSLQKPYEIETTEAGTSAVVVDTAAIPEPDPDTWPTDEFGLHWRNVSEENNVTSVPGLMKFSSHLTEAQAKKCMVAAFPGRRF